MTMVEQQARTDRSEKIAEFLGGMREEVRAAEQVDQIFDCIPVGTIIGESEVSEMVTSLLVGENEDGFRQLRVGIKGKDGRVASMDLMGLFANQDAMGLFRKGQLFDGVTTPVAMRKRLVDMVIAKVWPSGVRAAR